MLDGLSIGKEWLQRIDNTREVLSNKGRFDVVRHEDDIETEIVSSWFKWEMMKFAEGQI